MTGTAAEKTVAQKLLVKGGDVLSVTGAADAERALLDPLPDGVREASPGVADVAVTFVSSREELIARFGSELPVLGNTRAVWFLYPKGGRADVNRDVIMRESGRCGWRAVANISVDEVWSAVRLRPLKEGEGA